MRAALLLGWVTGFTLLLLVIFGAFPRNLVGGGMLVLGLLLTFGTVLIWRASKKKK